MSGEYTATQSAEGKIRLGIERLAGVFPFHAAILERLKIQTRPEVGTMGVTVAGDDVVLCHNPEFVLGVAADELGGVLLHEVHHVLFGHVLAEPADFPDEWARTVAEEVTVNEFVKLPLPGAPVTLDRVAGLPPGESTQVRYDRLRRQTRRRRIESPRAADGSREVDDSIAGDVVGSTRSKSGGHPRCARAKGDDMAPIRSPEPLKDGASSAGRGTEPPAQTADDHSVWAEARLDVSRSRDAVREVVRDALRDAAQGRLPDHVTQALVILGIGHDPEREEEDIQGRMEGRLDWRRLLRRSVGQALEGRPTFNRPPRRFPELVGILPGRRRQSAKPKIMAVIDTSASITLDLLRQIDAELTQLAKRFAVTVVECDVAVRRAYPYRGRLRSVVGRGGTDFRPPLARAFLRRRRPDLVVYFTDGFGPAPESRPGTPVIWCLTPGGSPPAPWGRVVKMDEEGGEGDGDG